ncbi:hypothetical protein COX74_00195 [bacterium (Candidatus Gribaldobacteria) CG_4_10_14_0_2_um_filter_41_16]|uniref:t-SNARE coiled-coil homology domain-containing protein n=2 Tax=Candidatus Gribaldobacteria TaxID=2798536 RepID=A0A2M7VJS4_9BACT|nr:MAG: hypothetical protein AUJ36_01960 [Parcubacteria group bacterium CG1_02_41_26]PIV46711.1 MAG: hypothetical protein COS21_03945 [bacterium (Candidatus Gribaldobacteria) CG02_land_8_20_14_3_00_41_15]PJA01909.1 MAG: hypothetical protein COX74_00195 [bacterium (Candidatus Gribaldobacteria) CG_4_10_14_0_2_um_filter_41_16]
MPKKNITINDLAIMVKHGFDGVDKRFDGVDKRFDGVDKRFDEIDKEFVGVRKRFEKIETQLYRIEVTVLHDHRQRIEKLEDEIVDIKGLLAIK